MSSNLLRVVCVIVGVQHRGDVMGAAYGPRLFSLLAILFLVVALPWATSASVNLAYLSSEPVTVHHPDDNHWVYGPPPTGPVQLDTWFDYANNLSFQWVYHYDRPETSTILSQDCQPYDWGTSSSGFPSTSYSITNAYATNLTRTEQFVWADDPFKAPSTLCTTLNDDIGIRINPAAILGTTRAGQSSNQSLGLAMTRFNATMVMFSAGVTGQNDTLFAEYDWRVEIDGEYVFGDQVRAGDDDSYFLKEPVFAGSSLYYPHTRFDRTLDVEDERRVRNAIAGKDISNVNMTLIWRCHETQSRQPGFPLGHEACEIMQSAAANTMNSDISINVQTTWIEADDYDFWIQGSAWVLSILMFVMAIASTPLWDPFKKMTGGV